jgi:hypothetical protein
MPPPKKKSIRKDEPTKTTPAKTTPKKAPAKKLPKAIGKPTPPTKATPKLTATKAVPTSRKPTKLRSKPIPSEIGGSARSEEVQKVRLESTNKEPSPMRETNTASRSPRISNPVPRTGITTDTIGLAPGLLDEFGDFADLEQLLNIKWSQYVPHSPTPKQLTAMMLAHIKEVFFGGALGGGKSDWLAYEALRFCDLPGFSAIIFRRQLTDLKQPGSLIPRIGNWLSPFEAQGFCKYVGDEHAWVFKTKYPGTDIPAPPARLQFGYIGEASVRERYQSAEYQLVCFDELGQWPTDVDYLFMRSRIRSVVCNVHGKDANHDPIWNPSCNICNTLKQIPLRMRAASNPGPAWIKRRFGIVPDPKQFASRHEAMIAISEGRKVNWIGTIPHRPFIPSYLDDNPHLDAKNYREMLSEMSEEERSRLEDGNWEARKNARFKRRWQRFYYLHEDAFSYVEFMRDGSTVTSDPIPFTALRNIFVTSDPAVTVKAGPVDDLTAKKSSSGVISTWGITYNNELLWLDCRKFRKEIPDFVAELVNVNSIWHPRFNKIECNGVGIGVAQYAQLAGLPVQKNYRKTDKLENSLSAQMLMQDGRIFFPTNAPWAEEIEDDVFNWTGLPTEEDDVVDTLSDAATELSPSIAREISAPDTMQCRPIAVKALGPHSPHVPHYGLY